MGKYQVIIQPTAEIDLSRHKKFGDIASIKKILKILQEVSDTPYFGTGNPEALKYDLPGYWSRRINKKDRMIYKVDEDIVTVYVFSALGHYD